jgi:spoIIIJ-associated protein
MAKANKKQEKIIKNFFVSLGIDAEMAITEDEEAISVNLESEDTGMIIGYHGETLEALQLVLSLVLAKEQGEFKRVSVEVGDYKKKPDGMARAIGA